MIHILQEITLINNKKYGRDFKKANDGRIEQDLSAGISKKAVFNTLLCEAPTTFQFQEPPGCRSALQAQVGMVSLCLQRTHGQL